MTSQIDNPAAPGENNNEGQQPPCPAQLTIRETTEVQWSSLLMLVPPPAPRYLLVPDQVSKQLRVFDLLRPSTPGVAVLHDDELLVFTAALSADGDSICLAGMYGSGVSVFDTAPLLAAAATLLEGGDKAEVTEQVVPRARAPNIEGQNAAAGAAFSHDADRLFVLWKIGGGITVHDPKQPNLPVLRRLSFSGPSFHMSSSMLACTGGMLAAAAGGGAFSPPPSSAEEARLRRQVRLWRVDAEGEMELRTLSNPDLADAVALSSSGDLLAVGLRNGAVRLTSPVARDDGAGQQDVYLEAATVGESGETPMAHTLCFSHDGSKLVVGRMKLDDFTVYDISSATVVGRFVHPKSGGFSAVFFPMDDVLVTGTLASGQQCAFHRLLPPAPRFELALAETSIASSDVASGGELGSVVALAAGSTLSVHTAEGKRLLHRDFDEELFSSVGKVRTAVRVQPGGKFVACLVAKKTLVVVAVTDSSEMLRVTVGSCTGMWWSPDGALLVASTVSGARVFTTETDFAEAQCLEDCVVYSCSFDCTGARLATGTDAGRLTIWEVASWTPTRTFEVGSVVYSSCFSNNGERLAYQELDGSKVGVLSLRADSDDEPLVQVPQVNAFSDLKFSPDDNFVLCCASAHCSFDQHRMRVLDLTTGTDAQWGELLRTMALPVTGGTLSGRTLGWARTSHLARHTAEDPPSKSQWMLYGAVGNRFVATDIDASLCAIEDNAWTTEQLVFCSEYQEEVLGSMLGAAPHCSNIRDAQTGETALHQLARARRVESLQSWLDACPDAAPVANDQGLTAVQVAVQLDQIVAAQALWQKMPASITSISASLVMDELRLLSQTHPRLVRPFLLDVEPVVVRTLATFWTELARAAEVCKLSTGTLFDSSDDDKANLEHGCVVDRIPSIWSDKCPADSPKQLVAWRVVLLPDLLGHAESGPFHDIVARCDASVFDSKLLELIVQYKWEENVRTHRMRSAAAYGCACVMATVAMLVSVTSEDAGTDGFRAADVLQGFVVVTEMSSLGVEVFQLVREGIAVYFTGPWNILDAASSSFLLAGSAYHFLRVRDGVRIAGALGAALKCFGLVDYLRSFSATGSLVRMISVILIDMIPFMTLLSIAMLGCTIFFAIHQSRSDSIHDLFSTLVTVFHMTLGFGQGIDISNASMMTVAVVTAFTSFVVVVLLNLLIAIMGDSYEKVKESERVEAIRERAHIVVEMEKRFPKSDRCHSFMHFVEVADSAERPHEIAWEGATRRMTDVLRTETSQLDGGLVELKGELSELKGEVNSKFAELQVEMSEMKGDFEKLDSKLDTILACLK